MIIMVTPKVVQCAHLLHVSDACGCSQARDGVTLRMLRVSGFLGGLGFYVLRF